MAITSSGRPVRNPMTVAATWAVIAALASLALLYIPIVNIIALIFVGVFILAPIDRMNSIDLGVQDNGFFVPNWTGILLFSALVALFTFVLVFFAAKRSGNSVMSSDRQSSDERDS